MSPMDFRVEGRGEVRRAFTVTLTHADAHTPGVLTETRHTRRRTDRRLQQPDMQNQAPLGPPESLIFKMF